MNPISIKDQMGRQILLPANINRIVSLVPSQTELLFDLGLADKIVGVTKFCVHPSGLHKSATIVGGTKQVRMDIIDSLQADLIIGNKEENNQDLILQLEQRYPVWMSEVNTLEDAYEMIFNLGSILGKQMVATNLIHSIQDNFAQLKKPTHIPKVAYFIWREPYMVATSATFIDAMIHLAGFENVFHYKNRYPEVTLTELADLKPDFIFLSTEPFPFKPDHFPAFQAACPDAKVLLVDGEFFSWYGSRLRLAAPYFKSLQEKLSQF